MSESKNEGDCAICMEKTNYAKCSNPRCHCFLCKEDYDTAAKNTYVAEPAEPNRDEDTSDAEWHGFMRKHRQEIAMLKPRTQRQHLLYKYNNSVAQGGKDERDKKVLISQGLAAMNVAEDTATEKQKKEALEMDDVGVICPCCGGIAVMRILKPEGKASSGRVTMSIAERVPNRPPGGFARGGIQDDDYDDSFYNRQLQQALQESLQLSRQPGQGAAVRRPQAAAAAAAAAAAPEPEDRYLAAALLASTRETETPIQQIHRELNRRGIQVSEEDVRRIFQQMSLLHPENDYRAIRETENYFVANPPPPPPSPFYPPPPRYDYQTLQRVVNRVREELRVKKVPVEEERLRSSVRNMLEHEPNEERAANSVVQLFTQAPRGGKKSKMSKSRRGKKSKMTKSRKGKKSKMSKSRRGKKSKMTRKKV